MFDGMSKSEDPSSGREPSWVETELAELDALREERSRQSGRAPAPPDDHFEDDEDEDDEGAT
jgi:hypothetical protein